MEEIRPRIRVAGILIENDKILLIQHYKNNKKYWLIPGGGNDWGETAKEALIREYKEETNMDIEVDEFLFFSETIYPNKERHILNLFFRIHRNEKNDSIVKLGDEAVLADLKFVTKEELKKMTVYPNIKENLLKLMKRGKNKMTVEEKEELKKLVRSVKDFPEKGVTFRDITTALKDKRGLEIIIKDFTDRYKNKGIDYVVGADARGFIFGAAIAYNIGAGFVPARKPGKLPAEVESVEYSLEYGKNSIEIHKDAFEKNSKILIVDDLLATGGTAEAMVKLVEKLGAKVYELAFMIELVDLKARDLLKGYEVYTQLKY